MLGVLFGDKWKPQTGAGNVHSGAKERNPSDGAFSLPVK